MARNPEALRITISISPDDKELFEQVSQAAPYRRGRYILRLAARGLLHERGHLQDEIVRIPPKVHAKTDPVVPPDPKAADAAAAEPVPENRTANPLEVDLSDLWSSSMLKM